MVLSTVLALASTYSSLLRIDSPMPRDPQVAESLWRELDAQPRAFDELAFFSQSVHSIRSLDYHRELAAKIAVQLAEARRRGYRVGINVLCTIGFMEDAADPALDSMPYRVVEGKRIRGSLCPTDPKTLAFIDAQYRIYAAVHPDFIYVDDDIDSCWCECARCQSVRNSQGQWKIKEGLFDAVARAVRAVDPAIELGGMFWSDAALDGGTWSRTLAGGKRGERLTRWRPGGGNWNDLDVFGLVGKLEKCASVQCRGLDPSVRRIQAEIENYPDLQLMKSPDYMGFEALAQLGWGANGIAWNFLNLLAAPASDYREFISKCAAVRPAAEKIVASLGDSAARGVSFRWKLPRKDSVPTAYELAMVGVPTASDPEHAVVTLLSAADVAKLDDGEIRTVLSGGVLMETAALSALNARGFGEWTGFRAGGLTDRDAVTRDLDHPLNVPGRYVRDLRTSMGDRGGRGASCGPFPLLEQTDPKASFTREAVDLEATRSYGPAAGVFENGLGGRIAVEPLAPFGTATQSVRAADVKKLLRWLSRDRLPGDVASFHRVAARFRSRGTFVMNVSSTSAKGVELALLGGGQLSCTSFMGGVETGSCALTPLRHDGPYAIYALPDMAPLGQLLLAGR